ncbi:hypothetical protein [Bradyrhizobium sp. 33ap4]|uniref:hypothetical protein n=1 Tax=Bradyrhizobium sp. 33ap4 TaxID=3061630 RepID=UPI003977DDD7
MTQTSCQGSLLVTRVGSTSTTLRPNSSHRGGEAHDLQDQRRRDRSEVQRKAWWSFSSTFAVVHREFVPAGHTVNSELYCKILSRLREDVRRKRPELWRERNWVLHHDNASSHSSLKTREFLARNGMKVGGQAVLGRQL